MAFLSESFLTLSDNKEGSLTRSGRFTGDFSFFLLVCVENTAIHIKPKAPLAGNLRGHDRTRAGLPPTTARP